MASPASGDSSTPVYTSSPAYSSLLSVVASGELPSLPQDITESTSDEGLQDVLTPFLPLFTRLQHSRRVSSTSHTIPKATQIDRVLLWCQEASKWRQYAQVFGEVTFSELKSYAASVKVTAAFRRFESGSTAERARIVLCEWLLQPPGTLETSELFANELYVDEVAVILVHALASKSLQTQQNAAVNPLGIDAVTRKCLAVPLGPTLLTRLAVNDPTSVEQVMDAVVAVIVESTALTTEQRKPIAQQEQEAMAGLTLIQENARQACVKLAQLAPLYATRLWEKLREQTTSLHCAAAAFELLTKCISAKDVSVLLYQWLKRDGGSGSVVRTYVQMATREPAIPPSEFQHAAGENLAKIQKVLLNTLDQTTSTASTYELTAALGVIVGLQVLGSFPLEEADRIRLLRSLDDLAAILSSRVVSLVFIVVVLVWYPLAPALSKAPGQRDEHTKSAVTLSQQALVSLFHARDAGAGPLFVVSAVLFYTKAPALVPFLASVIGLDGEACNTASASASAVGCGINVQQVLRAEYLYVFGDVVLKPVLTENLLARDVLTFPPASRVSALDAVSSGSGQHEFTLRGLHGLLCEKSFLRHHHGQRLENWLAVQIGEQAALPVHPLLVSLLLEWIENYIMAFEYPVAQAPRRLQLSIIPLRSSTLTKWLGTSCLARDYVPGQGQEHELAWARGVLGLTYALQFNQRLRHATMVAGSKLSSLVPTSSVVSGASVSVALGPGSDICLHYDLDALWRQQQMQTQQGGVLLLLTYFQILEEPFRLVEDAHNGVFCQPALLHVLLGLVRDVRAAANVHVTKCDPSLVLVEGMMGITGSTTTRVQQHLVLQDCLLIHGLLKRLLSLKSESVDEEVEEECRAHLCTILNELLSEDATSSAPRLLLAIHTQGYGVELVPILVAYVPAMKLLWDYWMTSSSSTSSSSSRSTSNPGTKPLMEFVAEGAEKDLPKWRFRLRVVLSLCAKYLSGSRQSSAMQQALRVVWNKLRNGVGNLGAPKELRLEDYVDLSNAILNTNAPVYVEVIELTTP
ncbi:hypothetical protein BBJ29_007905 [Phytophthora kernoviae]|uniref:Uncharacterized protein n=1 Tax=Phytophthora kernoviae TaxID=325452 RepID=A0A3F2RNM3_9STRA|nr:hypothetical protein BBJ29_007905 [Phytophthora kernoviae]RLN61203.1 hypothetical protein BBP00_00005543 [Phytophthora kernoviae]